MPNIYINYCHEDAAVYAGRLYECLTRTKYLANCSSYMATERESNPLHFVTTACQTIRACDAMLVLIGGNWTSGHNGHEERGDEASNGFLREIAEAIQLGIPIIPVLMVGIEMPQSDILPEQIRPLTRCNPITVTGKRLDKDVQILVKELARRLPTARQRRYIQWRIILQLFLSSTLAALSLFFCAGCFFPLRPVEIATRVSDDSLMAAFKKTLPGTGLYRINSKLPSSTFLFYRAEQESLVPFSWRDSYETLLVLSRFFVASLLVGVILINFASSLSNFFSRVYVVILVGACSVGWSDLWSLSPFGYADGGFYYGAGRLLHIVISAAVLGIVLAAWLRPESGPYATVRGAPSWSQSGET